MRAAGAADPASRCGATRADGGGTPSVTSVRGFGRRGVSRCAKMFTLWAQIRWASKKLSWQFLTGEFAFMPEISTAPRGASAPMRRARRVMPRACAKLLHRSGALRARLPESGASGSVRQGPANPARPGREQRYRERLGRRRPPEVPLTASQREVKVSTFVWNRSLQEFVSFQQL
jgi:hypothetical protein